MYINYAPNINTSQIGGKTLYSLFSQLVGQRHKAQNLSNIKKKTRRINKYWRKLNEFTILPKNLTQNKSQ